MTMRREGQSDFVDGLTVSKRGTVRIASVVKKAQGAETEGDAHNVLDKFDKSEDVPDEYIQEHKKRIDDGDDHKEVLSDFFKGLQKAKGAKQNLTIKTAKLLRQNGVFKLAGRGVYEDLQTGDFWKLSEDHKTVVRMFKENENGTADKVA